MKTYCKLWNRQETPYRMRMQIIKIIDKHMKSLDEDLKLLGHRVLWASPHLGGVNVRLGKEYKRT